ncbi:MAG: PulJ/GspJ family protein [Limisphaerales bacterium]
MNFNRKLNRLNGTVRDSARRQTFSCRGAFTIIEILLALAIFMLVLFAIYASWTTILRSSKAALIAAAEAQRSRIAMRAIEDALLTAQLFAENAAYYSFETDTSDENLHYLSFTARLPASFPGSGMFGDAVMRRISFAAQPGADKENDLVMTQFPLLLMTNAEVQPYPIILAKDVSLFILEFWNPQTSEWMADFKATNQLPQMMRVTLGVGHSRLHPQEPEDVISRIIAMPSTILMGSMQFVPIAGNNSAPTVGPPPNSPGNLNSGNENLNLRNGKNLNPGNNNFNRGNNNLNPGNNFPGRGPR